MLLKQNKFFFQIACILAFILVLSACDGRPSGVLSQNKMTKVLTEMHKTDATMSEKGMYYGIYSKKSPYYKFILDKYGITQAQFDSSLVWYTNNPLKFERIYDDVILNLTSLQNDIKKGKYHKLDSIDLTHLRNNIWYKPTHYTFTKDSARTHLNFEITTNLLYGDVYVLKFLQRIAPEDSCKKQRIIFRINYANGKVDSIYKTAYNDSLLRRYTFRFPAKRKLRIKSISGELLGSLSYKGTFNAQLDSISLFREFNAKKQDSLRRVVEKADPTPKLFQKKMNLDSLNKLNNALKKKLLHPV
ncbi:MAG: DUF4296 domain-containing protein [Paludibacter sp.]|nr:DUF4296 domain-containing protein [Paludibacter sp.]